MLTKKSTRLLIKFAGKSFGSAKLVFGTNQHHFARSFVCDCISPLCLRVHFVPAWPDWGKENASEHKLRKTAWQQTAKDLFLLVLTFIFWWWICKIYMRSTWLSKVTSKFCCHSFKIHLTWQKRLDPHMSVLQLCLPIINTLKWGSAQPCLASCPSVGSSSSLRPDWQRAFIDRLQSEIRRRNNTFLTMWRRHIGWMIESEAAWTKISSHFHARYPVYFGGLGCMLVWANRKHCVFCFKNPSLCISELMRPFVLWRPGECTYHRTTYEASCGLQTERAVIHILWGLKRVTVCVFITGIIEWLNDLGWQDAFRLKSSSFADSPDWVSCL